jgi:hypothetical protein
MQGLHGIITFGHGPLAVVRPAAILVLFGIGFGLLGRRTMRLS